MQPLPITDPKPVTTDIKVGAQLYLPDLTPKVRVSNVNDAFSPFGTRVNNVNYRAAYITTGGVTQLLLARLIDCTGMVAIPAPADTKHLVAVTVDGVKKSEVIV